MKPNDLFNSAVLILRNELSPDSAKIIRFSVEHNQSHESSLQHVGFGIAVRNLLARNGIFWEDVAVGGLWLEILKESIKTHRDGQSA